MKKIEKSKLNIFYGFVIYVHSYNVSNKSYNILLSEMGISLIRILKYDWYFYTQAKQDRAKKRRCQTVFSSVNSI